MIALFILGCVVAILGVIMMLGGLADGELFIFFCGAILVAGGIIAMIYAVNLDADNSLPDYGTYTGRIVSIEGKTAHFALETDCGTQKFYDIPFSRFADANDIQVMKSNARVVVAKSDCGDHKKVIDIVGP